MYLTPGLSVTEARICPRKSPKNSTITPPCTDSDCFHHHGELTWRTRRSHIALDVLAACPGTAGHVPSLDGEPRTDPAPEELLPYVASRRDDSDFQVALHGLRWARDGPDPGTDLATDADVRAQARSFDVARRLEVGVTAQQFTAKHASIITQSTQRRELADEDVLERALRDDEEDAPRISETRRIPLPRLSRHERTRSPLRVARAENKPSRAVRMGLQRRVLALPLLACGALLGDSLLRNRSFLRVDALDRLPSLLPAALVALTVTAVATWLATDSRLAWRRAASLRVCALAAGPVSLIPLLIVLRDEHPTGDPHELHAWGVPCFFLAYLIAAISLVVLAADLRRARSLLVTWQGVALASAAASWSALALLMHCPGAEPQHLIVGHVLPICALPLLGLVLARHALRLV